jgi:uncharacterized protein YuzE
MAEGSARWTYDEEARAWYFALNERAAGSYSTQIKVAAILDLDDEGRLAGIEIIDGKPDGSPIEPPLVGIARVIQDGRRR